MTRKRCSKCKRDLPVTDFARSSKAPDGWQAYCKECMNDYQRERMLNPKIRAQRLEYLRAYNIAHPRGKK